MERRNIAAYEQQESRRVRVTEQRFKLLQEKHAHENVQWAEEKQQLVAEAAAVKRRLTTEAEATKAELRAGEGGRDE